jgi:pimeloyl-ACP methyl ester carboxylesterase
MLLDEQNRLNGENGTVTDVANPGSIGEVEGRVVLSDGRRLGYRATGATDGDPLFYFHGFPGSRLEADLLCKDAGVVGWRVFAIDRPGMGLSDFLRGRTLHDWPRDVAEFANALRIDHFTVIGVSGGGPYAAITAWALKKRVRATGIVCGLGPLQKGAGTCPLGRGALALIRCFPWLIRPAYFPIALVLARWPLTRLDARAESLPPRDRAALETDGARRSLAASFRESVRQGSAGGAQEIRIYCRPWRFNPGKIETPVYLWHGDLDTIVPCAMTRHLVARIPQCRAAFLPEDGHFSLLINRRDEILLRLRRLGERTHN